MSFVGEHNRLHYRGIELERGDLDEDQLKEALLNIAVDQSDIDLPISEVEHEYAVMVQAAKQSVRYEYMAKGIPFYQYPDSLYEELEVFRKQAYRSVKTDRLLQGIIREEHLEVSKEELETEGAASAERLDVTEEMARMFYGDDYGLLKRDLLRRKAIDLIYEYAVLY